MKLRMLCLSALIFSSLTIQAMESTEEGDFPKNENAYPALHISQPSMGGVLTASGGRKRTWKRRIVRTNTMHGKDSRALGERQPKKARVDPATCEQKQRQGAVSSGVLPNLPVQENNDPVFPDTWLEARAANALVSFLKNNFEKENESLSTEHVEAWQPLTASTIRTHYLSMCIGAMEEAMEKAIEVHYKNQVFPEKIE